MAVALDFAQYILAYFLVLFSLLGWGYLIPTKVPLSLRIMLGLFYVALIATTFHFFMPLNLTFTILILLLGLISFFENFRKLILNLNWKIFASLGLFFSFVAILSPLHGDTALYHWQAIKWIFSEKIVLGLVNLHSRFGFNSSWWVIQAALNPFKNLPFASFISTIPFFAWAFLLIELFQKKSLLPFLTVLFFGIFGSSFLILNMGCVATDGPAFAILALIFASVLKSDDTDGQSHAWIFPALALLISIKPSMAVMVLLIPLLFVKNQTKENLVFFFVSAFYGVIFAIRGLLISGYPFYPVHIPKLQLFKWSANNEMFTNELVSITGWARKPGPEYRETIGNWDWLPYWFSQKDNHKLVVVFAICVALFFYVQKKIGMRKSLIILVNIVALAVWFISAPDIRFALPFILAIWLIVMLPIVSHVRQKYPIWFSRVQNIACAWFLFAMVFTFAGKWSTREKKWTFPSEFANKGIYNLAVINSNCGDAPLPCAAEANEKLDLKILNGYKVFYLKD